MNQRIQELIDQSSTMSWEVDHAVTTVDVYALAELIIQECARLSDECPGDYLLQPYRYTSTYIKEHFGVE